VSDVLVYSQGRRLALAAPATSVHWIGDTALFALGDGSLQAFKEGGAGLKKQVHSGAILCAAPHPVQGAILTGGDDGIVCETDADLGALSVFDTFDGKWVNHIVASPVSGVIAIASGKDVRIYRKDSQDSIHTFRYPSTVSGLALDAKGRRLAASHYGGITLRYALMADDKGVALAWAGSHLNVTLSPDADYVVSAMQESELHGWRLPEKLDLRMSGYAAKSRSLSWDKRGRWLATSGANAAIVWPFAGKLGPQGKPPLQPGEREALVTAVAFHPTEEVLAIGYSDGAALLVRFADTLGMELDEPGEGAVTALAWSPDGASIAIGDEAGRGAIIGVGHSAA
jgi:WD40 repeat protein